MPKKRLRWDFYIQTDGHFKFIGDTSQRWPNIIFENLAKRRKFDHLQTDTTLIGGYFANDQGDCLVCVPHSSKPESIYC